MFNNFESLGLEYEGNEVYPQRSKFSRVGHKTGKGEKKRMKQHGIKQINFSQAQFVNSTLNIQVQNMNINEGEGYMQVDDNGPRFHQIK